MVVGMVGRMVVGMGEGWTVSSPVGRFDTRPPGNTLVHSVVDGASAPTIPSE